MGGKGLAGLALAVLLAGCGGDESGPAAAGRAVAEAPVAGAGSGWIMPPSVTGLRRDGTELVVSGQADPGGRVVLRTPAGRAYAAVADAGGLFEVRLTAVDGLVLAPEAQLGQETVPGPGRLVILDAARGSAVLLSPGGTSQRLGEGPLLSSVDHDGRAVILSGRADPGSDVRVEVPGRGPIHVQADTLGHWRIGMDGSPPSEVRVEGQVFAVPALSIDRRDGAVTAITRLEREDGFLLKWQAPDGAHQVSWLPRR
ncbi:MAG: hypothetical protein V7672_12970 [Brevundimonas sp.]|uniref:hypothetical protein n=1 Tax=Brevundimonas sp. TaxID=1871086 RepID=UPI00300115DD